MSGNFVEKIIIRLVFSAVIFLLTFHLVTGYKELISGEGSLSAGDIAKDWTYNSEIITFFLKDYSLLPHLDVLVNGEVKGAFKNRYVTVAVHEGDVLAIDGSFYEIPVSIEVLNVSGKIEFPEIGTVFKVSGNVFPVGVVKVPKTN